MPEAQSSLNLRRTLLPIGIRAEYNLMIPLERLQLSAVVDRFVPALVETGLALDTVIVDYKGRDQLQLLSEESERFSAPAGDELLHLQGAIIEHPTARGEQFFHAITSEFDSFDNPHHIRYRIKVRRSPNLLPEVRVEELGRAVTLEPHHLRIGRQHFRSRLVSKYFGFAPAVFETLLLDADRATFRLRLISQSKNKPKEPPFQRDDVFARLSEACRTRLGFDLATDYREKLEQ